jgi:prepilin-type N-terminal cleavage/methylation domain-containing protein
MTVPNPRERHGLPIGLGVDVRSRPLRGGPRARQRAFTLLELVAVVSIITIFAALAIPSIVLQLRDRRVQEYARRIGLVYRQARMHALGRGSAVLVRFDGGDVTVHEARTGDDACVDLPASSCRFDWADATLSREIDGVHKPTGGELASLAVTITDGDDTAVPALDVCFTPLGRAFSRTAFTATFAPNASAYIASVSRSGAGRTRRIALLPNGTARLISE